MLNAILIKFIPDICYFVVMVVSGFVCYQIQKFKKDHGDLINKQEELIKTQIGATQYNLDKSIAESIVLRIEEEAKNFDWDSEIKHSKATELISKKTGLDAETIYGIIKATVTKIKMGQVKSDAKSIEQTVINNTTQAVPINPTPEQGQTVVANNATPVQK
mgnify:CR=1 FL=1|jgi:hypothetical protein